jgi:hypothetical protein
VAGDPEAGGCGVVAPVLGRALTRARGEDSAAAASLQLDLGVATALSIAVNGRLGGEDGGPKLLEVRESALYGDGCPQLFRVLGRLEGDPAGLAARVSAVTSGLRAEGRCSAVTRLLAAVSRPGAPATELLHAVDSLRLDEPDRVAGGKGGSAREAAAPDSPVARCPELPIVLERINAAINAGAPLYNKGDHAGCVALYQQVARSLRDRVIPAGRCPLVRSELDGALAAAARAGSPDDAAWAMRHGFDHIAERAQSTSH